MVGHYYATVTETLSNKYQWENSEVAAFGTDINAQNQRGQYTIHGRY